MQVSGLAELARPVRDLDRARRFYVEALGFAEYLPVRPFDTLLAVSLARAWKLLARPRLQRLKLGSQTLLLVGCEQLQRPPDGGGEDVRFQHIAVVTHDMAEAWQRVAPHASPISRGGPQRLPAGSGGVTAVKFRDPDGHPVELLAFPPDALPARWASGATGIDHSAISVSDAGRSIEFYQRLGLQTTARQTNQGDEQARLDGLAKPVVEVVAMTPPRATPHLELLAYAAGATAPARPDQAPGPRTTTIWSTDHPAPFLLTDPDGHTHFLLPSDT